MGCFGHKHIEGLPAEMVHPIVPRISAIVEAVDNGTVVRFQDVVRDKRARSERPIGIPIRGDFAKSDEEPAVVDVWVAVERAVYCREDSELLAALKVASAADAKKRELARRGESIHDAGGERDFESRYRPVA